LNVVCNIFVVPDVARYIERKIGFEELVKKSPEIAGDGAGKSPVAKKSKTKTKVTADEALKSGAGGGDGTAAEVGNGGGSGIGTAATAATAAKSVSTSATGGTGSAPPAKSAAARLLNNVASATVAAYEDDASYAGDLDAEEFGSELLVNPDQGYQEHQEEIRRKAMLDSQLETVLMNRVFGSQKNMPVNEVTRILGLLRQSRLYGEQGLTPYTQDSNGRQKKNSLFVKIYHDCSDLILKYIGDEDDEECFFKSEDYEPSRLVSQQTYFLKL
jgi:hypothetical protein